MLRSKVTFGHNALVLGEHFNADGTIDRTKVNDTIVLDERISDPSFRDTRDPYHLSTGGALGSVHKGLAFWRLRGRILVPDQTQQSRLSDRERQLRAAFDPDLCLRDSPSTDGAYTLDWDELTADTVTYPTGRLPQRIYARPAGQPQIIDRINDGTVRQFALGLVAPDPRIYEQALGSVSVAAAGPASVVNRGTVPAPLRITITMSAAGANNFTITRSGVAFVLDLTGLVNADEIQVVMETCGPFGIGRTVRKNGVAAFARKTSGPTTWLDAPAGTTSFTHANTTGIASVLYEWAHARP